MAEQDTLFPEEDVNLHASEWTDMPEFVQNDLAPYRSLLVHFESEDDIQQFAELTQQPITPSTRSIWFPKAEIGRMVNKRFADE